jgi:histone acetyltransferase (RNA polymerase elongator complex component)
MKKKHFNIPIFIPEAACPFQCIYCNQRKISGRTSVPDTEEINKIITSLLATIPEKNSETEIAFFGGNFTGLPLLEQENYLKLADPFIHSGRIRGVRLSTRPDYISNEVLELLRKYHVTVIELGAQSMDDEVLRLAKRGHTAQDSENSAKMILDYGFVLGLQMMIGLPGDTLEKSIYTAKRIIELKAKQTRIYPTLVIRETKLESMYRKEKYRPLSLEEAINWSKELLLLFENAGVEVLKLGLHPSEGLLSGDELVAGPFHPSFRELVLTEIWYDLLTSLSLSPGDRLQIFVPPGQLNYAIGHKGKNRKKLLSYFKEVSFYIDPGLNGEKRCFRTEISGNIS